MNIYKITKGQLATMWVFGGIAWISAALDAMTWYPSPLSPFLSWFIPFFLVFYTIGWKNNRRN